MPISLKKCFISLFKAVVLTAGLALSMHAYAAPNSQSAVKVTDGWVRANNPGQSVGAAYMTLSSDKDAVLTHITSEISPRVEVHTMLIEQGVMKMRSVASLPLPAKEAIKFAPGGLHVMLFDLKKPLIAGQEIPLVLHFNHPKTGQEKAHAFSQQVVFKVKTLEEVNNPHDSHDHGHHHHH